MRRTTTCPIASDVDRPASRAARSGALRRGRSALSVGLSLLAALLFMACSAESEQETRTPTADEYDDLAATTGALVGDQSSGELHAIIEGTRIARGEVPFGFSADADGRIRGKRFGVSYTLSVQCWDAAGSAVECGSATDRADIGASWQGAWDGVWFDADVSWGGQWNVTGLKDDQVMVTGDGTATWFSDYQSPFSGTRRQWSVNYSVAWDGLMVRTDQGRAVGGTASYYLDVRRMVDDGQDIAAGHLLVDADVTFSADGGTILLDGSKSYRLNTTTGSVDQQ